MPKAVCNLCSKTWIHWESLTVPTICEDCAVRMQEFEQTNIRPIAELMCDHYFSQYTTLRTFWNGIKINDD